LSLDDRAAARKQRAKQRARAEEEIARLNRGVAHFRRSATDVERRAQAILERRRVDSFLRLAIIDEESQPQAMVVLDGRALAAAESLDGRYCLVSNDHNLSADELFSAYKRQHLIESRFTDFKGPLQVRPVFLPSNRRIAALVAIVSLALLLYG